MAEEVDGVALEAESDVGVDGGGDADVGVAQEFLDHDEFDALLQEEGRRRVQEIMEANAAQPGAAEQGVEVPGEGGPFDRGAVEAGEDVAAVLPARPRRLAFLALSVAVLFEGAQTGVGRAMRRSELLVLVGRAVRPSELVRWRVRRMLAVPPARSRSSQRRPRSSPLRRQVCRASSNSGCNR